MSDVVVAGGGIIGAAVAWRAAQGGLAVTVVDPDPTRGAWHTAAGMLAPVTELHYTETPLLHLGLDSVRRYPAFCSELAEESGLPTGYAETGAVAVAWDAADLRALADLQGFAAGIGVDTEMLTGRELRALEPSLAAGLPGGMLAPGDHQVDPRRLHAALTQACRRRGVRFVRASVREVDTAGVVLADGTRLDAGAVVEARGAWSGAPVRPVKGQTLRLRLPEPVLSRVVRATIKGIPCYVVPRADGQVVVGASTEEAGFDVTPRAGAVYELLRDAQSLVPELGEAVLEEVCTSLRPGSPDNAPVVGRAGNVVYATGHYRNGVLLAPGTADAVAALLVGDDAPAVFAPFTPSRFESWPPGGAAAGVSRRREART